MATMSVIVPFLNEAENLYAFCEYIDNHAKKAEYQLEVIFVDDGSVDNSIEIIRSFSFQYCDKVIIIKLTKNFGSHAAIRAGISVATGDFCTYVDADLETPENMLEVMFENITKGYDAVYIEKIAVEKNLFPKISSKIYSHLMRKYAVRDYRKGGINNIMMSRKIIDFLNDNIEKNSSLMLQIIEAGFESVTVEMDYRARIKGKSKWTMSKKIKLFIDSFVSFSYFPLRMVTIIGIILAVAGIIYCIYIIIIRLFFQDLEQGFATIAALLLFGFGITNISLGIIAEYLWRTFDATRSRPVFIVSREIDIK